MRKIRKEQNGKVRQLLLKYFLKYFLILLIALTGSLLIVLRACQLTERNIIEENTWKLERGVDELEDQMLRMENVAETLRIAQGIRYLDRLEGSLSNEGYVELNYARESLLNASIMSDFAELTFVLFQENDCFVSEAQSAASFSQYYGEFLEEAGSRRGIRKKMTICTDGEICLSFPKIKSGQAVICAVALLKTKKERKTK